MSALIVLLLISLIVPVLVSAAMLDRHSLAWQPKLKREVTTVHAGQGAFRSATVEHSRWKVVGDGLPVPVFITAFASFVLGQMFVPGLLCAAIGALFMGSNEYHGRGMWLPALVLAAIPGAIVAVGQFRVGLALLRGRRADADRLTSASLRHVIAHNVVLLGIGLALAMARDPETDSLPWIAAAAVPFVLTAALSRAMFRRYEERFVADDPDAVLALPRGAEAPFSASPEEPAEIARH
ncbi:MAG: hypothetical protein U0269_27550 [Polyangiales bacterium]